MIQKKYYPLLAEILKIAADKFSNKSCDDIDITQLVPSASDRQELMKAMYDDNGDPENFDPDDTYDVMSESWLMGYFGGVLGKASSD